MHLQEDTAQLIQAESWVSLENLEASLKETRNSFFAEK